MKRCWLLALLALASPSYAGEVRVAVAANFYKPMQQLAAKFEKKTGHQVQLSAGSTGSLFAQIAHGAPFEVFLAADQKRPMALIKQGVAVAQTQFTYARGQLALWSANNTRVDPKGLLLRQPKLGRVAIANPKTAPYGAAAIEVIKKRGNYKKTRAQLVQGKNISQTFQYVKTGVVEQGFVALSQIYSKGKISSGSAWLVPPSLHAPLNQDAVLLKKGLRNQVAIALLEFLQSENAKLEIRAFGYQI